MNTQNIKELEESQNYVISQWQATLLTGIVNGTPNTEDSIQYTSIMGNFDKDSGLKFAQELANTMNINILVNRIESWYAKEEAVIHLVYDIDTKNIKPDLPVQANKNIDNRYGIKVIPELSRKLKM